jgi:formylglycine-generating enzyme required for sulfatase activity
MWEFAARTEAQLVYPWGDVFDATKCNSRESNIGGTSQVTAFAAGASRDGCCDTAGNTWQFVRPDEEDNQTCVLRGGSFRNDRFEVRSYLRLFNVPRAHRPDDFGIRLAQEKISTS